MIAIAMKREGEKSTLIQVEVHSSYTSNSLAFACFIKYGSWEKKKNDNRIQAEWKGNESYFFPS